MKIKFDVFDPFVVERNREEFYEFIKSDVDIIFANEPELSILFQTKNIEGSINQLMSIVECGGLSW